MADGRNNRNNGWYAPTILDSNFYTQTAPLVVDNEFRNCVGDLQHLYHQQYNGDPVMQLSQDWLGYLNGVENFLPLDGQANFST
jgi:hypothetical protein